MGSRSRSRCGSPLEHGYSKSGRRYLRKSKSDYSKEHGYDSRSPTPVAQHSGRNGADGHISEDRSSSARSSSPRVSRRRASRTASRSRSPDDKRRNNREKPMQSRCIGVFGLSVYTTQQKIREIFVKFGGIERIQVVIDAQTGRSRGFCFIYYEDIADAKVAKESCSGMEIDGRRIRVDYSITQRPHAPTPGVYMGKARPFRERDYYDRYRDDYRPRRRSITPYASSRFYASYRGERRRRYERSRSRSYTPRRCPRY